MHSVAEAQEIVLRAVQPLPPVATPLSAAFGRAIAEDVFSDLDMPPFDKSMMDGYAVRTADLTSGPADLSIVEEVTAGRIPTVALGPGQASRIMTGAAIPPNADAVVMVEKCESLSKSRVRVPGPIDSGTNIQPRGREFRSGECVLSRGKPIRSAEIGLLALVGRATVLAHGVPEVAVLATGDELVPASTVPGPGQIRNSNGPMVFAQVQSAGATPRDLGIARDELSHLRALVAEGLKSPVLILSGGVSAGKLDLVPQVLTEAGITPLVHKVRLKPGKPLFFGTRGDTLVFGLPGNPVSSFVGFELFVRPALLRLAGHATGAPRFSPITLAEPWKYDTDRPTVHPAFVETTADGDRIRPVVWLGSPDVRALTRANALVMFAEGRHDLPAGHPVHALRLPS